MPELVQAVAQTIKAAIGDKSGLVAPYTGPPCILNGTLTRRRRIAAHAFDLARVKAVAKASESTLNDVVLPAVAGQWTGGAMSNVPVSNVPGPRVQLFFDGAPLLGSYPTPVLVANMGLNITCVCYYKGLYLGLSACPDLLPNVQNLALYMGEAFNELEAAVKLHAASGSSTADKAKPAGSAVRKPRSTRGSEKAR